MSTDKEECNLSSHGHGEVVVSCNGMNAWALLCVVRYDRCCCTRSTDDSLRSVKSLSSDHLDHRSPETNEKY